MAKRLRKVVISSTSLSNNAASFVNETAVRLHITKLVGVLHPGTTAIGDRATFSLDEVPVIQNSINNSRSHVMRVDLNHSGGTGSTTSPNDRATMSFERGQLPLDPDDALFWNGRDSVGTPAISDASVNAWYED